MHVFYTHDIQTHAELPAAEADVYKRQDVHSTNWASAAAGRQEEQNIM